MELSIKHSSVNESRIIWAIVASILLHVLLAVVVPAFKFDVVKKIPDILSVELQKPAPPAPVAIPEPPKLEPPKPKIEPIKKVIEPKPIAKPITKKIEAPSPIKQEVTPPPAIVDAPPKVIAAEPKADTTPHEVVQAPPPLEQPMKEIGPSDGEIYAELKSYKALIRKNMKVNRNKFAELKGLEGKVVVMAEIDNNGQILDAHVCVPSEHGALDSSAISSIKAMKKLPMPKYSQVFEFKDPESESTDCTNQISIADSHHGIKLPIVFKNAAQ